MAADQPFARVITLAAGGPAQADNLPDDALRDDRFVDVGARFNF